MGLFGKLLGRSGSDSKKIDDRWVSNAEPAGSGTATPTSDFKAKTVPLKLNESHRLDVKPTPKQPKLIPGPAVNIWDLEDQSSATPAPLLSPKTAQPPEAPARVIGASARKRRTKTRLLGFEKSDGRVVDMMNNPVEPSESGGTKFPVGWVVVVKGPGRGESFTLQSGMSSIGRGEDQTVQLDFGDRAISRAIHAAIVYDPESTKFHLGHGGKSNIVRLNDNPVISNEALKNGDLIRIGETTLRFASLCGQTFNWEEISEGELDSVEIAGTPI